MLTIYRLLKSIPHRRSKKKQYTKANHTPLLSEIFESEVKYVTHRFIQDS